MSTKPPTAKPRRKSAAKPKRAPAVSRDAMAATLAPPPTPSNVQEISVATQTDTTRAAEDAMASAANKANGAAEAMTGNAKEAFATASERTREAMDKTGRMAEDMGAVAKGNMDALVETARIAATGAQDFAKDMAEYNRRTFEHVSAAMKEMTQAKSPTELFQLQSDYAQKLFDLAIAETSRTTESMMKLAGEVARPMQNQVAEATAKVRGR